MLYNTMHSTIRILGNISVGYITIESIGSDIRLRREHRGLKRTVMVKDPFSIRAKKMHYDFMYGKYIHV